MDWGIEWDLRPGAVIAVACGVLLVPLRWLVSVILAAVFHESCHILALKLAKRRIRRIIISASGTTIETQPLEPGTELLCALAGPVGSLLLVGVFPSFPELAVCGLVHGVWNLLPVYPLDGGRVLRSGLYLIWPERAASISRIVRLVTASLLAAAVCFGAIWIPFLRLAALFGAIRLLVRKNSCNHHPLAVQ